MNTGFLMRWCTRIWEHWSIRSIWWWTCSYGLGISLSVGIMHTCGLRSLGRPTWKPFGKRRRWMPILIIWIDKSAKALFWRGKIEILQTDTDKGVWYTLANVWCPSLPRWFRAPICFERRWETTYFGRSSNYIQAYSHRVVETVDFRKCIEEVSFVPRSVFRTVVWRAGYPHLRVESKYKSGKTLK